jgi:hypothetical protein
MKAITCGACKGTHNTVAEVRSCHTTTGNFHQEAPVNTKVVKAASVVKPTKEEKPKKYVMHGFATKEEAEDFIVVTPRPTRLMNTVKVKIVDGVKVKTYQVMEIIA